MNNPRDPKSRPAPHQARQLVAPEDRIAIALDTSDRQTFDRWCRELGPRAGCLKVGLEAFVRWGPSAVEMASNHARAVFLDLKLHDIPNTVAGAVASACDLGVTYLTVHGAGGPAMLEAATEASKGRVNLLGITLLTHLDDLQLRALDFPGESVQRVLRLAHLCRQAGCQGVVCSPLELPTLRPELAAPFRLVTPGIRPAGEAAGDQRRVATPVSAIDAGADLLVIGRPITKAPDPLEAFDRIVETLRS